MLWDGTGFGRSPCVKCGRWVQRRRNEMRARALKVAGPRVDETARARVLKPRVVHLPGLRGVATYDVFKAQWRGQRH